MPSWAIYGNEDRRGPVFPTTAAVAATTWDPSHVTNGALSNGNLTVTHTGGGNNNLVTFSTATNTTNQKVYFEVTVVNMSFAAYVGVSLDNTLTNRFAGSNITPSKGAMIGNNGNFACLDSADDGEATIASYTTGDAVDVAFDSASNKIWFRKNNGVWNSVLGTGDPAAGTLGQTVTNTPSTGPWYAAVGQDAEDPNAFTARFSSSSWLNAAPSGFTQINA